MSEADTTPDSDTKAGEDWARRLGVVQLALSEPLFMVERALCDAGLPAPPEPVIPAPLPDHLGVVRELAHEQPTPLERLRESSPSLAHTVEKILVGWLEGALAALISRLNGADADRAQRYWEPVRRHGLLASDFQESRYSYPAGEIAGLVAFLALCSKQAECSLPSPPPRTEVTAAGRFAEAFQWRFREWSSGTEDHYSELVKALGGKQEKAPPPKGTGSENRMVWRPAAKQWEITFRGQSATLRKRRGALFLAYLLAHPEEQIAMTTLNRIDLCLPGRVESKERASQLDGEQALPNEDSWEALDPQALQACRDRIKRLEETQDRSPELMDELEFLRAQVRANTDVRGRSRTTAVDKERLRKNISKQLHELVKDHIRSALPAFAAHLQGDPQNRTPRALQIGVRSCAYKPGPGVTWNVQGV